MIELKGEELLGQVEQERLDKKVLAFKKTIGIAIASVESAEKELDTEQKRLALLLNTSLEDFSYRERF